MPIDRVTETDRPALGVEPIPRAARLAALACAALGASGVLGWLLDIPSIRRLVPGLPEMQPNTALSLLSCGISLALPSAAGNLARLLALFPAFVGGATAVEFVTGLDLGIDNAFIQGTMRMAPQTSVSLCLVGLALLARRTPGREALVQPLAVLPVLLAYLSLVGMLFDAQVPYFPLATTMALHTATAIVLVGWGLALSQPGRGLVARWGSPGPGGRTVRVLLPAFVALPPVLAFLRKAGEEADAYDEGFGIALQATVTLALLAAGVLLHGGSLDAAEEERTRQTERFRRIVEDSPEGVGVMDLCGRLVYANARLAALLGRPAAAGLSLADCVEPAVRTLFLDFLRRAEHGPASATIAVRSAAGELRFVRFSAARLPNPLAQPGGSTLLFAIDDTSRRLAEDHLRHRARQLEQALRDLDAFASLASHDLREPLRKIQLLADRAAAESAAPSPTVDDALHRIRRCAAQLQDRVAELLSYSRLAAARRILPGVDLGAVVRGVEAELAERLRAAGASVVVGVLPTIDGDPTLLAQLFRGLLENALRSRRSDVPLVVEVASEPRTGRRVEITVADNGVGLDEGDAATLFAVLRKPHPEELQPGSGIPLATCRRIAELHGGEITVRGRPGAGSVFTIYLPIHAQPGVPPECVPSDVA